MNPKFDSNWVSILERIAALESAINNISAELGGLVDHENRIAALETLVAKTSIGSIEELEERIAALEETLEKLEGYLEKDGLLGEHNERIAALEDIVVKLGARHELLAVKHHERIAALEEKFK